MKTLVIASLAVLASAVSVAAQPTTSTLSPARSHAVRSVGQYIEKGTPRIQVIAKLGRPTERLGSEVWVYRHIDASSNARVDGSCRSLLIRFDARGAVAEIGLLNERAVQQVAAQVRGRGLDRLVASHTAADTPER